MNDQGLSITGKWPIIITEMVMLAGMMGMLWFGLRGPGTAMANISNSFVECPQGMSQECDEIPRDFRPVASPTPLGAGQTFGGQAAVGHGLLSIPASEGSRGADVLLSYQLCTSLNLCLNAGENTYSEEEALGAAFLGIPTFSHDVQGAGESAVENRCFVAIPCRYSEAGAIGGLENLGNAFIGIPTFVLDGQEVDGRGLPGLPTY